MESALVDVALGNISQTICKDVCTQFVSEIDTKCDNLDQYHIHVACFVAYGSDITVCGTKFGKEFLYNQPYLKDYFRKCIDDGQAKKDVSDTTMPGKDVPDNIEGYDNDVTTDSGQDQGPSQSSGNTAETDMLWVKCESSVDNIGDALNRLYYNLSKPVKSETNEIDTDETNYGSASTYLKTTSDLPEYQGSTAEAASHNKALMCNWENTGFAQSITDQTEYLNDSDIEQTNSKGIEIKRLVENTTVATGSEISIRIKEKRGEEGIVKSEIDVFDASDSIGGAKEVDTIEPSVKRKRSQISHKSDRHSVADSKLKKGKPPSRKKKGKKLQTKPVVKCREKTYKKKMAKTKVNPVQKLDDINSCDKEISGTAEERDFEHKDYENEYEGNITSEAHTKKLPNKFTVPVPPCRFCGKLFQFGTKLREHCKKFHGDQPPFQCNICKRYRQDWSGFVMHMKDHTGAYTYTCKHCRRNFNSRMALTGHVRYHHGSRSKDPDRPRPFKCDQCDQMFHTSALRKKHLTRRHVGKKEVCPICNKRFAIAKFVEQHIERMHPDPSMAVICHLCGKTVSSPANMVNHLHRHLDKDKYKCPEPGCEVTFHAITHMRKHIACVHKGEKQYVCDLCGAKYAYGTGLKSHMKSKHSEDREFQCPHCDKSFTESGILKQHINIHLGLKPYPCEVCGKQFSNKGSRHNHMRVHKKETNVKSD